MNKRTKVSLIWGICISLALSIGIYQVSTNPQQALFQTIAPTFVLSSLVIAATIKSLFYN